MERTFKTLPWLGTAVVLAFAIGCSSNPSAPTPLAPAPAPADTSLKATAPVAVSPMHDVTLDNRRPTMVIENARAHEEFANRPFAYEFELMTDGGHVVNRAILDGGSGTTAWGYHEDLERDSPYRWRARATLEGSFGPWSEPARFFTVKEKRTPNPPPGGRLPRPDWGAGIVAQVAAQRPDLLHRSCQEHGGTWEFMDLVVDTLRLEDTRFGYNCKRGNCNDPSLDVIAYNRGIEPDEGTRDVWIIDIILGHCGPNPGPAWFDVTQITIDSGTLGRWTSRGRF